jgi:pimeloyl-ACP methyl ester carboxylesterase
MTGDPSTHPRPDPVLILVHGATLNGRMWDVVRRHLDSRYRILTPDLPGHGSRRGERYTLPAAIATVVNAAQSAAPAPVILIGDSLGAYTSMASASKLPRSQLSGLVLGGATYDFAGAGVWSFVFRGALFRALAGVLGEQRLIAKTMPKEFGTAGVGLSLEDSQAILDAGISVVVFGQAVRALRGIDWRAKLAAIEQPVLIVNGDLDKNNVVQEAGFLKVAKAATSHRFVHCKHGVSLYRPREFAALVNDFVERVSAETARS